MVLCGTPSAWATSPAGRPPGPASTKRRNAASRVSWARAARTTMASDDSICRDYSTQSPLASAKPWPDTGQRIDSHVTLDCHAPAADQRQCPDDHGAVGFPQHVGLGPGFIHEHQAGGIKPMLMRPPACPPARQVRPVRLTGQQRFLEAEALAAHEAPDGVVRYHDARGPRIGGQGMRGRRPPNPQCARIRLDVRVAAESYCRSGICAMPASRHEFSGLRRPPTQLSPRARPASPSERH